MNCFNAPFFPKNLVQDFSKENMAVNFTLLSYCNFMRKVKKVPSIIFL